MPLVINSLGGGHKHTHTHKHTNTHTETRIHTDVHTEQLKETRCMPVAGWHAPGL